MYKLIVFALTAVFLFSACYKNEEQKMNFIDKSTINKIADTLIKKYGQSNRELIERGISQAAAFWTEADGSKKDFVVFCTENYIGVPAEKEQALKKLSDNFEVLFGHFNKISLDLKKGLHLDGGPIQPADIMFGSYEPGANLTNDFFRNKIAFYVILNFPYYSLEEKTNLGQKWSRLEWAYARLGDMFTSRIDPSLLQNIAEAQTKADTYISDYNIFAGNLVDDKGQTYFPKDMKLLSHWNLRDELKSQYAKPDGLFHQKMLYEVMKRIITQEIPQNVINSNKYQWNPFQNKVFSEGKEVSSSPEPNTRYQHLLNNFIANKAIDNFNPYYKTFISRKFDQEYEIPQKEVEELFVKFVSSPTVKKVASLIKSKLGRELQPFDIWYDGFKARSSINEDNLTKMTQTKYPNPEAFAKDMVSILTKLGFTSEKANYIASKIDVDPARGSGHAWGAQMKSEKAHLRTRIGKDGMNYKGYNIAIHEFGHNVEQTITLNDVDYYMMNGVPNTAFTEAMAFVFQKRDLELLGIKNDDANKNHLMALDNFWSAYEIMGVSLVDMKVWKWLYEHPTATAEELKVETIKIAKEIWNKYYAEVLGGKDQPLLAIYSHMIDNPLYLSAYPIGHLIEFQVEEFITGKSFSNELTRILTQGRLIPEIWMKGAVSRKIAIEPTINATEEALKYVK